MMALAAALLCTPLACAQMGPPISDDKKIIAWGCDLVDTTYFHEHISELEHLPFDGMVISLFPDSWKRPRSSRHCVWFGGTRYTRDDFKQAAAELAATTTTSFTDNFIDFETAIRPTGLRPITDADANLDWFNENWSIIADNAAIAAYIAKVGRFKGLYMDVEPYLGGLGPWRFPFDYDEYVEYMAEEGKQPAHSLAEYQAQVRLRGSQFMKAVTDVYPDITIVVIENTGWGHARLVSFFVQGMMEARGQATIIDGGEGAYPAIIYQEFADMRKLAQNCHREPVYDGMQYAFGVWLDANQYPRGFHTDPAQFHKNYRTPLQLENTLYGALTAADKYVWMYIWYMAPWWRPTIEDGQLQGVPQEYVDAFRKCRQPHDLNWSPPVDPNRVAWFDDPVLVEGDRVTENSKNLLVNPSLEAWGRGPNDAPDGWILKGQGPAIAREETRARSGKYSAALTSIRFTGHVFFDYHIPAKPFLGKTVTFGAWVCSYRKMGGLSIFDHAGGDPDAKWTHCLDVGKFGQFDCAGSGYQHPGDGKWHFMTATKRIRPNAQGDIWLRLEARMPHEPEAAAQSIAPPTRPLFEVATLPPVGGGHSLYPVIVTLEDERLFLTCNVGPPNRCVGVFSSDSGQTWSQPVDMPDGGGSLVSVGDRIIAFRNHAIESSTGVCIGSEIWWTESRDAGKTWSARRKLPFPYKYPSGMTHAGIRLRDGTLFVGVSWDTVVDRQGQSTQSGSDYKIGAIVSADKGESWQFIGELHAAYRDDVIAIGGVDEPSYVELDDGSICLLARTGAGRLYQARSGDGGKTWSEATPTEIRVQDSPSAMCRLKTGEVLVLGQDAEIGQMCIWLSTDDCHTWSGPRQLIKSYRPGGRYGSITQAADGTIVAAWTQYVDPPNDRLVKIARFSRAWLLSDG